MYDEETYCTECGREMPSDLDGGACWDCQEKEVDEHEADLAELNKPLW